VRASFTGRLLAAAPSLVDPNFDRTVVLVLEHTDDGALGLVLNRPSEIAVGAALPGWDLLAAEPSVVFLGGPVAPTGAIGLALSLGAGAVVGEGWQPLFRDLGTVDLDGDPGDLVVRAAGLRVFVGHAGWGPTQLETEVEVGAWFVLDAFDDDPVSPRPDELWPTVLRRQGGAMARVANFPDDPTMN